MGKYHIIPKIEGYTRKEVVAFFRIKLTISKVWAIKACCKLYEQQTYNEQRAHMSNGHNGVGFNKNHSLRLSSIARVCFSCLKLEDVEKKLTSVDLQYLKKTMRLYAAQLASLSDIPRTKALLDDYYGGTPPIRVRLTKKKKPDFLQPDLDM